MAISSWFARNDIPAKEPEVWAAVKYHIDTSLTTVYREIKKEGVSLTSFYNVHKSIIHLLCPAAQIEQLVNAEGRWDAYQQQLNTVVASSKIGETMWSWAQAKVVASLADNLMTRFSAALQNVPNLTAAEQDRLSTALRADWNSLPGIDRMPMRRECTVMYRGRSCQHVVNGLEEELRRRIQAEARGRAAQAKSVRGLLFEEGLVGEYKLPHLQVEAGNLFAGCDEARAAANEFCSQEYETPNGEDFSKVMKASWALNLHLPLTSYFGRTPP